MNDDLLFRGLSSWYEGNPDFDSTDELAATRQLIQRQVLVDKILQGRASLEEILELIQDQGDDVDGYVDNCLYNLENLASLKKGYGME